MSHPFRNFSVLPFSHRRQTLSREWYVTFRFQFLWQRFPSVCNTTWLMHPFSFLLFVFGWSSCLWLECIFTLLAILLCLSVYCYCGVVGGFTGGFQTHQQVPELLGEQELVTRVRAMTYMFQHHKSVLLVITTTVFDLSCDRTMAIVSLFSVSFSRYFAMCFCSCCSR